MSRYGPPGGPGPVERPPHGYDPPYDPWGDGGWEMPLSATPGYSAHPTPAADVPGAHWSTAADPFPPPAPRRRTGLFVALALVVLVAAGAVATTVYLISGDDRSLATPVPAPTAGGGGGAPTAGPPASPDNLGLAAGFAQVGDCLVNDGTDDSPQMRITLCDAEEESVIYRVLARFDETVADDNGARRVCGSTDGYRFHYYFISEGGDGSFVLCMTDVR